MRISWHGAIFSVVLLGCGSVVAADQESLSPDQLIQQSITYHDPQGVWARGEIVMRIDTAYSEAFAERAGRKEASVDILLCPGQERFQYTKEVDGDVLEYSIDQELSQVTLNGNTDISEEDKERLRVGEASVYRDYCEYLYGMPMKLRDPGTKTDPQVTRANFNGEQVLTLRVTYDAEVGEDIWYFYFDEGTSALVGYRFFHDEAKNDGEYITLTNEVHHPDTGLRLPKTRAWYYNADDGHLATDNIGLMEVRFPE